MFEYLFIEYFKPFLFSNLHCDISIESRKFDKSGAKTFTSIFFVFYLSEKYLRTSSSVRIKIHPIYSIDGDKMKCALLITLVKC